MSKELIPIIILPAFFMMIAYITAVISNNSARRTAINSKLSSDLVEKLFLAKPVSDTENVLKHGLVGVFIGLAFICIHILRLNADEPMTYGMLFLFAGGGMLSYYTLAKVLHKDDEGTSD